LAETHPFSTEGELYECSNYPTERRKSSRRHAGSLDCRAQEAARAREGTDAPARSNRRQRRALPWERIDKAYTFDTPEGRRTLGDLFEGRSQLMVQHFMFGPGWKQGCPSCSFMADHTDGMNIHLAHRDVTFVAISRATLAEIERFRHAHGLAVQVGVLAWQRLQPRLPR